MKYEHVVKGQFLSRPNRFIAHVSLAGDEILCHVKNTGRCRELLVPGAAVYLAQDLQAEAKGRKTAYDLVAVKKGGRLINMDSQAPNQAAWEYLSEGGGSLFPRESVLAGLRREVVWKDSRFDLSFTRNGRPALLEVKGVTLEENGVALFPDAPTQRGIKHLHGLARACRCGFEAYVLFVIQMKGIRAFRPNDQRHPAFGGALREAAAAGVQLLACDCIVAPASMRLDQPVPIML